MFDRDAIKIEARAVLAFFAILIAGTASFAEDTTRSKDDIARIEKFKTVVADGVEARRKLAQIMNDTVFSFGELAYQEFETSKYLTGVLEKNGFSVERGIAGIPTAWVARWGSGRPVIALGSDIDCLPKASRSRALPIASRWSRARSGARRGPQFGTGGQHRRGACGEGRHGARKTFRHAGDLAGRRRGAVGRQGLLRARRFIQGRGRRALHPRGRRSLDRVGPASRQRSDLGRVHVRRRVRARRECAVARTERAARRRADEHRLGFSPRASAPASSARTM